MVKAFGRWLSSVTAVLALIAVTASGASATSVLLYDDVFGSTSTWGAALSQLGLLDPSNVATSDNDFKSKLTGGTAWDLVIVQLNQTVPPHTMLNPELAAYLSTGRVIFSYGLNQYDSLFQVTQAVVYDNSLMDSQSRQVALTFSASTTLGNGLVFDPFSDPRTVPLSCPVGGACFDPPARGFTAAGGTTVAASFQDGSDGIVIGNSNRSIINPFSVGALGDNEVQLYKNEIGYLLAVPEPATATLLGLGLIVTAALGYRRRTSARG